MSAARQDAQVRGDRSEAAACRGHRDHRRESQRGGDLRGGRIEDIFLAFPSGPPGRRRNGCGGSPGHPTPFGVESPAAIEARRRDGRCGRLQIVVEIDCGARRSGAPPEVAVNSRSPHANAGCCRRVFTYPGHGGSAGARERAARDQRRRSPRRCEASPARGHAEVVSAGSTPTIEFSTSTRSPRSAPASTSSAT